MGLRFRKSIKIVPGVRLNVGKKSAGLSFGGKGLRYSINSRTGGRLTASIPGTGLSYTTSVGRKRRTPAYRRQNELRKLQREQENMLERQRAAFEVEAYENYIEMIHSIHKESDDPVDWAALRDAPPPYPKGQPGPKETAARKALENYTPGWFDKWLGRTEKKRAALEQEIIKGKQADEADYKSWEETVQLAERILAGDTDAYLQVIEEMDPFDDLVEFGSGFEISVWDDARTVEVEFEVRSAQVIPKEVKSLTKTGKLSVREMTKTAYYQLEQDYVCSCAIRIARDLFALLPVSRVLIHATDEQLNTATGYPERVTILSVLIDRPTLERLNLDQIDCSDAMVNFQHRMRFLKTRGFQPVERLTP
jgi:hypothetical protein